MKTKSRRSIVVNIILPVVSVILLFFFSVWLIIIPITENNLMKGKKEMISELTHTAWSLIDEFYQDYQDSIYTLDEAKSLAIAKLELMRYGTDNKDYFWLIDNEPRMIMHPYITELNGQNLSEYEDPSGYKLFLEATKLTQKSQEGYLNYYWQLRDDTTKIVQKISYVKSFPEWNWIIGSGIYIEDVREDILELKRELISISLGIILITTILLFFVIRQSIKIEKQRTYAESKLKQSREKFRSLVEASTEGTILFSNNRIIYANQTFCDVSGYTSDKILGQKFEDLFNMSWDVMLNRLNTPGKSIAIESELTKQNGESRELIISLSKTYSKNETRVIVTTKELGLQKRMDTTNKVLRKTLQTQLLLMNQPIKNGIEKILKCDLNTSIENAVRLMNQKQQSIIWVHNEHHFLGYCDTADIIRETVEKNCNLTDSISNLMNAPIHKVFEEDLWRDALVLFKKYNTNYLGVQNSNNQLIGYISRFGILSQHENSLSRLQVEIENAQNINQLKTYFPQVAVITKNLLDGGIKSINTSAFISSIIDAITIRTIELSLEEIGPAPCEFAFLITGSQGRKEQTLFTDQDNAIVYDDKFAKDEKARQYFLDLAEIINQNLDFSGIHLCKGNMMANNPKWNQSFKVWQNYFSKWIENSDPQSLLEAAIFFDLRCIYGKTSYCRDLQALILEKVSTNSVFFQHFSQSILNIKLPNIQNNSEVDIKKMLMVITGFARIYSLKLETFTTNTIQRLNALSEAKIITYNTNQELQDVYEFLMTQRLMHQTRLIFTGENPNNQLNISELSSLSINSLRKSVSVLSDYQSQLSADFKGIV
jgi:PAS domain S-box-containing protein